MSRFLELVPQPIDWKAITDKTGLNLPSVYTLLIGLALLLLSLCYTIFMRRRVRRMRGRMERAEQVIAVIKPEQGLENNLDAILEMFDRIVDAPVYAFYVKEQGRGGASYVLKAVRHHALDFGKVRPAYSGLADYQKETYHPPLSIGSASTVDKAARIKEGEVPMLEVPLTNGLVRIGPIRRTPPKSLLRTLDELAKLIGFGLSNLIATERLKTQSEVVLASGRAMQEISHVALSPDSMIDLMIRMFLQSIQATGGCFIDRQPDGTYRTAIHHGMNAETAESLRRDNETVRWLRSLIADKELAWIKQGTPEYYQIPPYLAGLGSQALAVVRVGGDAERFLLFWFERLDEQDNGQSTMSTLTLIQEDLKGIVSLQLSLRQLSGTYAGILKGLAQLLDNLSPYTVGYSELMSRYSIILAKEMGLPEDEIRDIALAAYLSNIGMIGISTELYQKEGKFTEQEFELMKLHAEVGASIIRTTIGNDRVASMVLHHHERMDGNGYPAKLRNDEIPAGARIIAVVQTFLAKINGRKYREPLPFHKALQTLQAASGSQLDTQIVNTFIGWFERKQKNPSFHLRSLGSCWEMCCTPSSVCEHCPAYKRTDVNCWDVQGNNCQSHGKSCATCFVHTEYVHRAEMMKRA